MKTTEKISVIDPEDSYWYNTVPDDQDKKKSKVGLIVPDTETGKISKNKGIIIKPQRSAMSLFCRVIDDAECILFYIKKAAFCETAFFVWFIILVINWCRRF